MENQNYQEVTGESSQEIIEIIKIKFSRKLARPFTAKNGNDMVAISIPNADPEDKRSWEEFVLPVYMVHSDHYGSKTLWAEIPADGTTTLSRSVRPSAETGEWSREERTVDNKTLKSMVEAYKTKTKTQAAR